MKPGTKIGGKYRLVRPLGEGGMGVVWAAVNELTEREVALKLIRNVDATEESRARLLREARACGRIVHRNVVQIYDVGETDAGDPFLVMELLNGETVGDKLERELRIPADIALRIAADTARGLRAAHGARVMHRDLKPSNLFLHHEPDTDSVVLKIVDFGISKTLQTNSDFTATGRTMGSPAYMSPEQVKGLKTVDHRTDLWSLGAVLAEMISGRRVFQGLTPYGAAAEVLSGKIRTLNELAPGSDPRIGAIVDKCLQREVSKRYGSADELLEALAPLLADDGLPPATTRSIPPPPPSVGRASLPPPPAVPQLPVINMTDSLTSEVVAEVAAKSARGSSLSASEALADVPHSARGLPVIENNEDSSIHMGLSAELGEGALMLWSEYVRQRADDVPASRRLSQPPPPADPNAPVSKRLSQPPPAADVTANVSKRLSQPPPAEPLAPVSKRLSQPPPADVAAPVSKRVSQPPPEPAPVSRKADKPQTASTPPAAKEPSNELAAAPTQMPVAAEKKPFPIVMVLVLLIVAAGSFVAVMATR